MILKQLKSNYLSNLFVVPIALLACWSGSFWTPSGSVYTPGEQNILFPDVFKSVAQLPLLSVAFSAVLVFVLSLLIAFINKRYQFLQIRSHLVALLLILLLGGLVRVHTFHPVYFAAVLFLLAISRLFGTFGQIKAYFGIFEVGFLLGTASLFYFDLVFIFPAFLIGLVILGHGTQWRTYVILLLGFLLPFLFAFCYFFYTDNISFFTGVLTQKIGHPFCFLQKRFSFYFNLWIIAFFILIASIDILRAFDKKSIQTRKYFMVLFFLFLFSIIPFVMFPDSLQEMLVIAIIPVTFLVSNFFAFFKRRFWGELSFTVLFLMAVLMQFF